MLEQEDFVFYNPVISAASRQNLEPAAASLRAATPWLYIHALLDATRQRCRDRDLLSKCLHGLGRLRTWANSRACNPNVISDTGQDTVGI